MILIARKGKGRPVKFADSSFKTRQPFNQNSGANRGQLIRSATPPSCGYSRARARARSFPSRRRLVAKGYGVKSGTNQYR